MKVLFLGPRDSCVLRTLRRTDRTRATSCPVTPRKVRDAEWLISHRYTHKVPPEVLAKFDGRTMNIHAGLITHHRGVHPVFFSALLRLPLGFTIHRMTDAFDLGKVYIIHESVVCFSTACTFREIWNSINADICYKFRRWWPQVKDGVAVPPRTLPRHKTGRYFSKVSFELLKSLLYNGWDSKIHKVKELYENRNRGE
jgi:hypothetical protein